MTDTTAVSFEITSLERCRRGAIRAVFDVVLVLVLDGVEVETLGWSLVERRDTYAVNAPQHRGSDGRWVPSIHLPPELVHAVADEAVEMLGIEAEAAPRDAP